MTANKTSISFHNKHIGLGLWCLAPHLTIVHLNNVSQFYWYRKSEYRENPTDMSQVLSHNALSSTFLH